MSRSADFQSAVPQACSLQGVGGVKRLGAFPRPADLKSAIRQITNLRYERSVMPHAGGLVNGPSWAAWSSSALFHVTTNSLTGFRPDDLDPYQ